MLQLDARTTARLHGVYYLVGGLWPLVSMKSFEKVTGGKWDDWLVRTVGLLMISLAAGFFPSATRDVPRELRVIGLFSSASVGGVAAYYGLRGRISRLYLLDAALQFALAALWLRVLLAEPREKAAAPEPATTAAEDSTAIESIV